MKKNKTVNQFSLSEDNNKKLRHYALVMLLYLPLALTLIVFPLLQAIRANALSDTLYYLFYYLSQIVQTLSFFGFLALLAVCIRHKEAELHKKLSWGQAGSLLLLFCVLETLVYLLMAYVDSLYILPISLSDKTLGALLANGAFEIVMTFVSLFLNAVIIIAVMLVASALMKKHRDKSGFLNDSSGYAKRCALSYLTVSLAWHVLDNVLVIVDSGLPTRLSDVMYILMPYIETGIFTACGFYLIKIAIDYFEE